MTGQDAVNVAKPSTSGRRHRHRADPRRRRRPRRRGAVDARRHRPPIKLIGVGEKLDALEDFHPDRIAGRILGMGDIVSLVEKAAETIDKEEAEKLAAKVRKGQFDMDDLLSQLRQLRKMGGMQA
jgi:signal recognition particle subunit SRP54